MDNDGPFGSDQDYTNGTQFEFSGSFTEDPNQSKRSFPLMLLPNSPSDSVKWRLVFGQKIWTPENINDPEPDLDERPYAGLLYTQMDIVSISNERSHSLGLMLGITGPNSFAEKSQKFVHKVTGSKSPNGWDNQIEETLIANINYDGNYLLSNSQVVDTFSHELSMPVTISIGNFRSDLSAGALWRWGRNLNGSFGSIQTKNEMSFKPHMVKMGTTGAFLFTGAEARYRFSDITIEGQRPNGTNQTSVEHVQMSAVMGGAIYGNSMGSSLTVAVKSKDFEQDNRSYSANVSASLFWYF